MEFSWTTSPYTLLMLTSAVVGVWLSVYGYRFRQTPGAKGFILLTFSIIIVSVGKTLELTLADLHAKQVSVQFLMIGIDLSGLGWLILGLQQTYRYRNTLNSIIGLAVIAVTIDLLIIWTNDFHHLFWKETEIRSNGEFHVLGTVRGPSYVLHTALIYLMVIAGSFMLIFKSYASSSLYFKQRLALLAAVLIPMAANVIFIFQLIDTPLDYTPVGYLIACWCLAYGYFRLQMVETIPLSMDNVIENLPDPIIILDHNNRIRLLNRNARALLNDDKSSFTGEILTRVLSNESPYQSLGEASTSNTLQIVDGARIYEARSTPVTDRRGLESARLFMLQDVTEKLSAEEAHQENLRFFRQFADALPIPFYELDATGHIIYGNNEMQSLFGYNLEQLQGMPIDSLFLIEDKDQQRFDSSQDESNRDTVIRETTAIDSQGVEIPVINLVASLVSETFTSGKRGVLIDITHRKRLEEAIQQSLVAAEQSNQVKSQFLANMSHEIRTPLNGVIGFAQLLAGTQLDNNQKRYVDLILKSGKNLLQLISDILDLSRIEAGKMELDHSPFDPTQCISDITSVFSETAQSKELEFSVKIVDELPSLIKGDVGRISQILNNVIGNAIKFTEKGEVSLQVKVKNNPDSSGHQIISFSIRDTGIGIAKENLGKLFDPFAQLDGSITRRFGGTGLGLAITADLIHLMKGSIHVESALGEGSLFTIELPMTPATSETGNRTADSSLEKKSGTSIQMRTDSRILLVEDNQVNREVAIGFLERMGLSVETASNGRQAVTMAEEKNYDIILMDIHMPEVDGIEATRQIRQKGLSKDTPIVGVTADVMAGQKEKCFAAGMTDHISKPLVFASLRAVMEKYLSP